MQLEKIKVPVKNGERENLEVISVRLPYSVAAQLDGLARSRRQSRSLYLSRVIAKHVREPDDGSL